MARFQELFSVGAATRILDIGGTPEIWSLLHVQPRVTLVNMPRAGAEVSPKVLWVAADARALPFRDAAFDIVFSNSVIEHVGDAASQEAFAREVTRVGRSCYVQTPNRWFPVETHLLTPLVHWLPRRAQAAIVRRFSVWALVTGITGERKRWFLEHYLSEIRLLDRAELRRLFPPAIIHTERFLGWTKSLIAVIR
jgi:SAM-dependent methyltransferase